MKKFSVFLWSKISALVLLAALLPAQAAQVEVRIQNFQFNPNPVTINVGDTVLWRQMDSTPHTATSGTRPSGDGLFDSNFLSLGQTFPHTFNSAGTFRYFCRPHFGMDGTVIVQQAAPQAPTVSITGPANDSTLTSGSVTITADASVNGSTINSVEFFSSGTSLGSDDSAPYSVSVTLPAGTHSLTARATAANGQATTSTPVMVTVSAPAEPPTISITAPANNATLSSTNVTIAANASATGGATVTMVEFFSGTQFLGMVHGAPFTLDVALAPGTHALTVKATSSTGLSANSAPVNITITLAPSATPIDNPYPPMVKTDLAVELETVLDGIPSPLGLAAPDDGSGRLFIYDQTGVIYIVANGARAAEPLLDVRSRLVTLNPAYDERGLLGLALHPGFNTNGLLYTYTSEPNGPMADFVNMGSTTNNHQSVIAEWKIDPSNSNRVDTASRREIMRVDQPQSNHNAGGMHFGPDGLLYIAFGDGGGADDEGHGHSPQGNGQDLEKILGKMARIDVNARTSPNGQYGIPTDNPFAAAGTAGVDEIYALGFRNPYMWSFDKLTGEMYVADVGQNMIEEINRVFRGGNYGWPVKEGSFFFHQNGTNAGFISATAAVQTVPPNLVDPIAEYDHSEGTAIVGGFLYRGAALPGLMGKYVTGDFGTFEGPAGRLFVLDRNQFRELRIGGDDRALGLWIKGFGQDASGELYVMGSTELGPSGTGGKVLKLVPLTNSLSIASITRQGTNATITFTGGTGPFVLQGKSSLSDRLWRTVAASSGRSITLPMDEKAAFFRVGEGTGQGAIPFTVVLSGESERPDRVNTTATGSGILSLEGNTLHFDVRYSGLSSDAVGAHIHGPASASEAAGVLVNLEPYNGGRFGTAGVLAGSVVLTAEQKAAILAGKTYVNVHSGNHQTGEIRGQIAPVVHSVDLSGAKERLNPVATGGTGSAILLLVGDQLTMSLDYAGLTTNAHLAHIHGAAGSEGAAGVMVNLAPLNGGAFGSSGTLSGTVTLDADQRAALLDGLTYVNIHTPINGSGEIRGQILPATLATPFTAVLSGAAERPTAVDTPASGSGTFALEGNTLHFNIRYANLKQAASAAHIHGPASTEQATNVLVDLGRFAKPAFGASGVLSGSVQLTEQERAYILQGRTYVNIHTPAHQAGEIRGQIAPVVMHAEMLGASERGNAVVTTGKGGGTFLLVGDRLHLAATYAGLSGPATLAHIHGPAVISGTAGVLHNMEPLNGGAFGIDGSFGGSVTLEPAHLTAVIDGLTYFNIHTGQHGSGEIRGQIIR